MASAVTIHSDTSSLSNNRGRDLISLLFSLQMLAVKVRPERSEYAETILGLRPLSYSVLRMTLPSIHIMFVAEEHISLRKTSTKTDIRSAVLSLSVF